MNGLLNYMGKTYSSIDDDDDDFIIIKKVLQKGNHIHRLTALLEHGKFRAEHYPRYNYEK